MSNKSIGSKIQGLEERLRAENESRNRDDSSPHNVGGSGPPGPAGGSRPPIHMNAGSNRTTRLIMKIPPYVTYVSQDSIEIEKKLREIKMTGHLTIGDQKYPSDTRDLEDLGELGNGTCGHVVKMLHKPSQAIIAVKQMRRSGNSEENKRILMDLDVVRCSHDCPYIVRCLGCFITEADVWICMELMASCFDKILKRLGGPVPEDILGKVTIATVKALSYLKDKHGVMHRDVKPSNILVDMEGSIKLCDFGISGRLVDSKAKTRSAGCAAYMAPERIDPPDPQKPDYDIRADVWSLGISLVELATGKFPYRDCQNDFEVLSKVIREEPPALPENLTFSTEFKSFVQQCLTKNYHNRPKYGRLLQHSFLQNAEKSGAHVGLWLATVLPPQQRLETPPITRRTQPTKLEALPPAPTSMPPPPPLNGAHGGPAPNESEAKSLKHGSNESPKLSPVSEHSRLSDSKKPSQESPDQSLSESSKASCISNSAVDQNLALRDSLVNRISPPVEDGESSSFSSMTIEGDSVKDINMASIENLVSKQVDEADLRIQSPPIVEKTVLRLQRNPEYYNGSNLPNRLHNNGYPPMVDNSPKEYYLQQRVRSFSNTMVYGNNGSDRNPPPRYITGSPNTKNYFANLEIRNQPFSGGGPSSFDSYTNPVHDSGEYHSGSFQHGSPEVNRRQFFSPIRKPHPPQPNYPNEYMMHPRETHQNVTSPPNFVIGRDGYENVQEHRFSPNFRTDIPTNYFTSTSVCTMSRFGPVPVQRGAVPHQGVYHQNPGGSCSQPASLEAYGETRHYPPYVHARPVEKNSYSPALWSPQPAARRSVLAGQEREREERWRQGDAQHHHSQVQGNTSPIVLQRFYHQQSQRRSRRDLRDGSPRQRSSVSREASVGRSPEPPRRAHRDPSNGRTDGSPHRDQQSLRERLERERIPTETHIPERIGRQQYMDRDRQPDLIRPLQRYDRDVRYSQDPREIDSPMRPEKEREIVNVPKERYELRSKNEFQNQRREMERRDEQNGDCRSDKDDSSDRDNLCSPRERFECRMQERKNNKEVYHHSRERDRRDEPNGDMHRNQREDSSRLSPLTPRKHAKGHKDKDDQGGHGSRDRGPRTGVLPRRVLDSEDTMAKEERKDGHFVPGLRYNAPQPPPRRATESWSLPGSPLPARPS